VLGPVPAAATADSSSAAAHKLHGTKALHGSSSNTNSPYSRRPSASYLIAEAAPVYGLAVSGSSNALNSSSSSSSSTTANSSSRAAPAAGGSSNSHSSNGHSNGYSSSGSTSSSSKRGQHTVAHRAARSAAAAASAVVHTGSSSTVDNEASHHPDRLSFIGSTAAAAADTETASTASASASSSSAGNGSSSSSCSSTMSTRERLQFVGSLWPYMLPLCLIYFAEYCMQVRRLLLTAQLHNNYARQVLRILIAVEPAYYVTACA
jgi:hypothetical protein